MKPPLRKSQKPSLFCKKTKESLFKKASESLYGNQAGFSLIGVMVAASLGIIVVTGLTQMLANMASKVNEMENRGKRVFFNEFVGGVLRDGCENSLKATPDDATDPLSKTISKGDRVDFYRLRNENDQVVLDLSAEADRLEAQYGIVETPHFQLICPEQDHDKDPATPPEANCDCRGTGTAPCSRKWVLSLITQRRVRGFPVFNQGISFELDVVWESEVELTVTHTGAPPYPTHFHKDFSCNVVGTTGMGTTDMGRTVMRGSGGDDECQYFNDSSQTALIGCGTTTSIRESTTTAYGYNAGGAGVGKYNTFVGYQAGESTTTNEFNTGRSNVFAGYQAGKNNTYGLQNIFLGYQAGYSNKEGHNNIFVGGYAGYSNTTGYLNVFVGRSAGSQNKTGKLNTFVGNSAGSDNKTGNYNTFVGGYAGTLNETASNNTFVGHWAGYFNKTGKDNTFLGRAAGYSNKTGDSNVFLGNNAGWSNIRGGSNTFIGSQAGRNNTAGVGNTFLGRTAGYKNTGSYNTFLGNRAGYKNTNANYNTIVGNYAGYNNTGSKNTFVGNEAGRNNTTGQRNTFLGHLAGKANTRGDNNTFLGDLAGHANTLGHSNTFLGREAGRNNTTGVGNVFLGNYAGRDNKANSNTFVGNLAGYTNRTGSNSIIIRAGTNEREAPGSGGTWGAFLTPKKPRPIAKASPESNNILIGSFSNKEEKQMIKKGNYMWIAGLIEGDSRKKWVAVHNDLNARNLYASLNSLSDKRLKKDIQILDSDWSLSLISKIQPYSFEWKDADKGSGTQWGFMAQELKPKVPALVKTDHKGFFYVNYPKLIPLLVSAFQKFQQSVKDQFLKLEDFRKEVLSKFQVLEDFKQNILSRLQVLSGKNLKLEKEMESLKAELAEYKTRLKKLETQNEKK